MTEYARVYGGSLYDLAAEEQLTAVILEEMTAIKGIFRENPDYLKLLSEPSISKDERIKLIEDAFGNQVQRYLVSFLKLLCEKGILREYEGCTEEFTKRYNEDNNIAEAVVTSAVKLSDSQLDALKSKLENTVGKRVSIINKIDASVLAGLKVELEGKQFDGTVQGRLTDISKKINETII
ncbi:MAG: ATP synthase F1 subunit delta [Lachnospiraceae bacterium]|nr:ATP synthase F1 subunit delta [Lachnospiraceae bacterium]